MGLLIDIVYEIIVALFFFGKNPRIEESKHDSSWVIPYWLWMVIRWTFVVFMISITCWLLYVQSTGSFGKKVPIGRIENIESGISCFHCPWLSVQTGHARIQVDSTKNFSVGNEIYLTRSRLWGLQACNNDTCNAAQINKAPDEILRAISISK